MPRTLPPINAIRVTRFETPSTSEAVAYYDVGRTTVTTAEDGSQIINFAPARDAANADSVSVPMTDTSTPPAVQQALAEAIFQQEGLTLGVDRLFGPDGTLTS